MNKIKLKLLIEEHLHVYLDDINYSIKINNARDLLTHNRFDLGFKIFYLKNYKKIPEFARNVYKYNISACTFGKFNEYGDTMKNNFEDFCIAFNKTYNSLKDNGFNTEQSIIPLSNKATIINGAHRLASSIVLNQNVSTVSIDAKEHIQDYLFFKNRGVPNHILDIVATEFITHSKDTYIALIWPSAVGKKKKLGKIIKNIVYSKEIKLNKNGAHNLITQVYKNEEWLGCPENDFKGSHGKLVKCFDNSEPLKVIVFQNKSLTLVKKLKDEIRNIYNIGKHSIHITDNNHEVIAISKLLFNNNALHFLNYAKPNKYNNHSKIFTFLDFIKDNSLKVDDFIIDSGMVLSLYGVRKSNDIDYFTSTKKLNYQNNFLDNHDDQIRFHKLDKKELLCNPSYYFYYNNLKFVALKQILVMKKNRRSDKDIPDCKMIEALLVMNNFSLHKINYYLIYQKAKIKVLIINFLKLIKIHRFVKNIFKIITGK